MMATAFAVALLFDLDLSPADEINVHLGATFNCRILTAARGLEKLSRRKQASIPASIGHASSFQVDGGGGEGCSWQLCKSGREVRLPQFDLFQGV